MQNQIWKLEHSIFDWHGSFIFNTGRDPPFWYH